MLQFLFKNFQSIDLQLEKKNILYRDIYIKGKKKRKRDIMIIQKWENHGFNFNGIRFSCFKLSYNCNKVYNYEKKFIRIKFFY